MKKLKVLLVAYNNLGKGGIQNQLMGIIRSLKDRVEFHVVIWDNVKDYYTPELEQYGIKIIRCFRNTGSTTLRKKADAFIRYGDIRQIITNIIHEYGPYDAIHCNNAYDAAPCLDAAKKAGIPVRISHAHNTENPNLKKKLIYPAYQALYEHSRRKIRRYATHMIGCSRQVTDYFFGKGLGSVVHIGIDLSELYHTQIPDRNDALIRLLHVGNMSEQKNQLFLLDVMENLVKYASNVRLTLVGSGPLLGQVQARIEEKQLSPYVAIAPPETHVIEAMANSDLFVFPSIFEGFGIVLIEAQAIGLPCIASNVVTEEANCGGIEYLPLSAGPAYWADILYQKIISGDFHRRCRDVSKFSVNTMAERIYRLYQGG